MAGLVWTEDKPTQAGWYWYRGGESDDQPFIVEVDESGCFQWPDGGYQEAALTKGEWAGPIERPKEL